MHAVWPCVAMLLAVLLAGTEAIASAFAGSQPDGWHTWQIDAPDPAAEMCCFSRGDDSNVRTGCNLDARRVRFIHRGDCLSEAGKVQVYVQFDAGRPTEIRVLSSECPVTADSEIRDHGVISTADGIAWFRSIIEDRSSDNDLREQALLGLVQSQTDAAYDYIDQLLSGG